MKRDNALQIVGGAPLGFINQGRGTALLTNNSFWGITSPQVAGGTGSNAQIGDTFLGSRPTLDTTTLPYKTIYLPPVNLSIINARLAMIGLTLATVPPGTIATGGGGGAFALTDQNGLAITDGAGVAITTS